MFIKKSTDKLYEGVQGRVAVIVSDFNSEISEGLLMGLESVLGEYAGVQWQVYHVPGAFEIPLMAQKLVSFVSTSEEREEVCCFDVIVALGCVIKGDTYHFDLVANECARGCMDVMLRNDIPVVFEVLASYSRQDAEKRSSGNRNHGIIAAQVALEWLEKFKS